MSERRERLIQLGQEASRAWKAGGGRDHEHAVTWIVDTITTAVDAEYAPLLETVGKMLAWNWEGCPSLANAPATDMAAVRKAYLDLLAARRES